MTEVISVRFKNKGKVYFFDPADNQIASDVNVIVETSKGLEFAYCTWGNHWVDDSAIVPPLRPVIRTATEEDLKRNQDNKLKEAEAFRICQEKILKHEIDMKLVDVEYNFEGTKILFFFTSDGRVDFRELVKDLASVFRTRIELRQIGVRDEAKMLGGLGICGKPFCCSQFLDEFHPVSIKMAKTQGLSLNPTKISGTCGRLMCCLKYEQVAYEDLVKRAPKVDSFVETPGGKGSVMSVNLLRGYAKVRLEDSGDTTLKTYPFDELDILGGKARRAEYITAKAEGKLEEAGFTPSNIHESRIEHQEQANDDEAPFIFADGTIAASKQSENSSTAPESRPSQKKKSKKPQNKKTKPQGKPQNQGQKVQESKRDDPLYSAKQHTKSQASKGQQQKRQRPPKPARSAQPAPQAPDKAKPSKPKQKKTTPVQKDISSTSAPDNLPVAGNAQGKKRPKHYYSRSRRPNKPESKDHQEN